MLSKLIKYEFKSTARIFIPLYVVLLVSPDGSDIAIENVYTRS